MGRVVIGLGVGQSEIDADLARMAARSADKAADFLVRVFAREGWIAPPL